MARFWAQYRRIILFTIALILFFWLLWVLRNLLLPFLIGLILAYLLLPPILWIEKKLPKKNRWMGFKRILLILLIYLAVIGIVVVIGIFTIPSIVDSINQFIQNLPQLLPELWNNIQDAINRFQQNLPPQIRDQISGYLTNILSTIGNVLRSSLAASVSVISGTFGLILGFLSLPVFLFYILKDAEKLSRGFYSGMSPWTAEQARNILGIIQDILGRYLRSAIILGLAVGILDLIGLTILGIPYAVVLALWAGVTEIIPILGPWIGATAGVIVTLATDASKTIWVVILYLAVQILEGNLLVPRIHGEYLQIHPAVIIVLLVIGGHFAGFWGIILIVPVTSVIVRLYRYIARTTRREEIQRPQA